MEGPLSLGISLIAHRCRTSDRTPGGARGVQALAPLLAKRLGVEPRDIGTPEEPRESRFDEDLSESRGCILEAGGQVDDALSGRNVPVLLAGDCSIALTTLAAALRHRPDARVLWLDAHGDFNTPDTTQSGFLGGMPLSGACGLWDAGFAEPIDPAGVVLVGVRDLDEGERDLLERSQATVVGASLETLVFTQNALDRSPVYVHLDLDVLDPESFPAGFPAPGGLAPDKLYDLLEAVAGECEIVGLEVTGFEAPEDELERQAHADTAARVLEPLLSAIELDRAAVD
ncbi:MAG: arginase family protein [Thermoleophilaceae bacterium]